MADSPAPTDDDETVTLTRKELRELTERLATLEAAKDDRRDADTAAEREKAEKAEREAAEKLRDTARKMGLEPEQVAALRELVADTQRDATREAVREVLAEYEIEVRGDDDGDPPDPPGGDPPAGDPPAEGDTPASSLADLQGKPDAPPPPPPPPDDEPEATPETTHWFHRPIVRREKGAA